MIGNIYVFDPLTKRVTRRLTGSRTLKLKPIVGHKWYLRHSKNAALLQGDNEDDISPDGQKIVFIARYFKQRKG